MSPTAILGDAWNLYKAHWKTLVPIALVVYIVLGLLALLLGAILGVLGVLIAALIGIVGTFWVQGALVEAVRDVREGRADLSLGDTFRRVQPKLPAIIIAGILAGIAIAIGFILLIVPGLFLLTIFSMVIPAIVLENRSAGEAFGRSRELVRGNGWNVFGVIILTFLLLVAVGIVIGLITSPLGDEVGGFVADVISNTIVVPFVACAWTLTYFALVGERGGEPAAAEPMAPMTPAPPADTTPPSPPPASPPPASPPPDTP
jgi:hypothetical protein